MPNFLYIYNRDFSESCSKGRSNLGRRTRHECGVAVAVPSIHGCCITVNTAADRPDPSTLTPLVVVKKVRCIHKVHTGGTHGIFV